MISQFYLTIQCSSKFIPNGGRFVIGKGRNSYKHENCMITTSAAQYVYQEKINYFGAQWFFVCIVLTLLWACCSLVMKVDKGLIYLFIYLFIYFLFIHCFNVLNWRCKAVHAFSTPKLTKRERERNLKVRRITLPYRPYTHRNPSKDIDLLRHPLFPRGLSEGWANHVSLILPMLTARHWAWLTLCVATSAKRLLIWQQT